MNSDAASRLSTAIENKMERAAVSFCAISICDSRWPKWAYIGYWHQSSVHNFTFPSDTLCSCSSLRLIDEGPEPGNPTINSEIYKRCSKISPGPGFHSKSHPDVGSYENPFSSRQQPPILLFSNIVGSCTTCVMLQILQKNSY